MNIVNLEEPLPQSLPQTCAPSLVDSVLANGTQHVDVSNKKGVRPKGSKAIKTVEKKVSKGASVKAQGQVPKEYSAKMKRMVKKGAFKSTADVVRAAVIKMLDLPSNKQYDLPSK